LFRPPSDVNVNVYVHVFQDPPPRFTIQDDSVRVALALFKLWHRPASLAPARVITTPSHRLERRLVKTVVGPWTSRLSIVVVVAVAAGTIFGRLFHTIRCECHCDQLLHEWRLDELLIVILWRNLAMGKDLAGHDVLVIVNKIFIDKFPGRHVANVGDIHCPSNSSNMYDWVDYSPAQDMLTTPEIHGQLPVYLRFGHFSLNEENWEKVVSNIVYCGRGYSSPRQKEDSRILVVETMGLDPSAQFQTQFRGEIPAATEAPLSWP
ncbi:hypothetical protein E4U55_000303, partial [Claviceps digitariae]